MDPIKVDFSGKGRPKEVVIPPDRKVLKIIISLIVTIIGGAVAYYMMLPALNFKSLDFYYFIAVVIAIYVGMIFLTSKAFIKPEYITYVKRQSIVPVAIGLVFALVLGIILFTNFMDINNMTRQEFLDLPILEEYDVDCDSIVLLPTREHHDSGYNYFSVAICNGVYPCGSN